MKAKRSDYYFTPDAPMLTNLGYYLFEKDKLNDAQHILKFTANEFNQAYTWNIYGMALSANGNKPEAVSAYKKALSLDPNDTTAKMQLQILK